MKNMMLLAKNCRKIKLNLYAVICILALVTVFTACTEEVTPPTLNGDIPQPDWTVPADYDYTSSMTAVINVSLLEQYPSMAADWQLNDSDRVAAFAGSHCLGVAAPQEGLFYLYIAAPLSEASPLSNNQSLTLRYYSAHFKNLFEAKDVFSFKNDDHLGTVAEPLTPTFTVVK